MNESTPMFSEFGALKIERLYPMSKILILTSYKMSWLPVLD